MVKCLDWRGDACTNKVFPNTGRAWAYLNPQILQVGPNREPPKGELALGVLVIFW